MASKNGHYSKSIRRKLIYTSYQINGQDARVCVSNWLWSGLITDQLSTIFICGLCRRELAHSIVAGDFYTPHTHRTVSTTTNNWKKLKYRVSDVCTAQCPRLKFFLVLPSDPEVRLSKWLSTTGDLKRSLRSHIYARYIHTYIHIIYIHIWHIYIWAKRLQQ